MSHHENRPGRITSLLSNRSDRGIHPESGAEYPGRSSPPPVVPAPDGASAAAGAAAKPVRRLQKFGPFSLKLTPDDLAGGLPASDTNPGTRCAPLPATAHALPRLRRRVCRPLRDLWEPAAREPVSQTSMRVRWLRAPVTEPPYWQSRNIRLSRIRADGFRAARPGSAGAGGPAAAGQRAAYPKPRPARVRGIIGRRARSSRAAGRAR